MFKCNRSVNESSFEYVSENLDKLTSEMEEFNPEIIEKSCNGMNLSDLASLVKISDKSLIFQDLDYTYLFLAFLKSRKIKFDIISEFTYDEEKDKYKNYRAIE